MAASTSVPPLYKRVFLVPFAGWFKINIYLEISESICVQYFPAFAGMERIFIKSNSYRHGL
jgi:hypothetical protein